MSDESVTQFYDELAADYHLIFKDWDEAIRWQAEVLDDIIRSQTGQEPPLRLYDCSCGIGTQTIGLAARGYRVHATDISPVSVERTQKEAAARGLDITTGVADFLTLSAQVRGQFDVVITCDNALPHLLTDDDLQTAAHNIYEKLTPSGLFLATIRDYDALLQERPAATPARPLGTDQERRMVIQLWDWEEDSDLYTVNHFILKQPEPERWEMAYHITRYRALRRDPMASIFKEAGFTEIQWHMPEASGYYQPVMTARRPA